MQLRRGHAIFIHEIWLKCVVQLSSPAPVPTLAHECQLNPRDGVKHARALGSSAHQDDHLSVYYVSPIRHLELPSGTPQKMLPLAIHHRRSRLDLGECWTWLVVRGYSSYISPDMGDALRLFRL